MRGLIAVCTAAFLGSCSPAPSVLEQIAGLGVLRVVTHNSPATFYYDDGKTPRGIEYELARGFAQRLGVELEIYTAERYAELYPEVARRRAHIGAASLAVTEPRARLVTFGPAYQRVEHQVIYRRGTARPKTVEDLAGGWIEIAARSTHAQVLETARRQVPELTWATDPAATAETLIRRVAHGDIDYAIVDSNEYQLLRQYYPEAQAAFGLGPSRRVAWALPRQSPWLRERVAAYFAEIEATGELRRILDRHFFAADEFDYVGSRAFVRHLKTRLPLYRGYFEEAEAHTGLDWRLLAAVSYQESHWNPEAVSPTGVRGLMMLTQSTAAMMDVADRDDP